MGGGRRGRGERRRGRGEGRRGEGRRGEEEKGKYAMGNLVYMLYFGSNTNLVCSGGLLPQHKMKVVERFHIKWVTSVVS